MRAAVRLPNWIGDVVLSLPAIKLLSERLNSKIILIGKGYVSPLTENLEFVSEFLQINGTISLKEIKADLQTLLAHRLDLTFLFTNSFHSALVLRLGGHKNLIGYKNELRSFLLNRSFPFPIEDNRHHAFFYTNLIDLYFQIKTELIQLVPPSISEKDQKRLKEHLQELKIDIAERNVVFAPGAAYGSAKTWPISNFKKLAKLIRNEKIADQIIALGSNTEANWLNENFSRDEITILAGKLSLREVITLLSIAGPVIANDSGLMHLAASLNCPLIALFGPTEPQKTAPLSDRAIVLYHQATCAPCKYRHCPRDHRCMVSIQPEEVLEALKRLIK